MPIDTEDSGFLSRWSRRKAQVRLTGVTAGSAKPPVATLARADKTVLSPPAVPTVLPSTATVETSAEKLADTSAATSAETSADSAPPAPTLADVATLTHDSDYARFVTRSVQPDVRNAALGKLFTDPHFNVMDGLDVYIDDYGKPDPLPPGMLRQMLQAHVLGLFDDEDQDKNPHAAEAVAQAEAAPRADEPCTTAIVDDSQAAAAHPTEAPADENTDLQLQPDDGAGRASLAPGAGADTGCPH